MHDVNEFFINENERFLDLFPFPLIIKTKEEEIIFNESFCKLVEYNKQELNQIGLITVILDADIQLFYDCLKGNSVNKKQFIRLVSKSGSILSTIISIKPLAHKDTNQIGRCLIIFDSSEFLELNNYHFEESLGYKELFDNNPNPMWIYDTVSLRFLKVNEAAVVNYGYSFYEFYRMTILDIRPEEDVPRLLNNIQENDESLQRSGVWRHRKKNGTIIFVNISSHSVNLMGKNARLVLAVDITDKQKMKQVLENENAKLKSIIDSTTDMIFSVDKEYNYTCFNLAHKNIIKILSGREIEINKNFLNYLPSIKEKMIAKSNFDKVLMGNIHSETIEITINGTTKFFDILHNPIYDDDKDVIGVSVFAKDISENKLALDRLRTQELNFKRLFNESITGDFISSVDGKILLCNPEFLNIFGFESLEAAYTTSASELYINPTDRIKMIEKLKIERKIINKEITLKRRDGKSIDVLQNMIGIFNQNEELENIQVYILNITEQKKALRKIKQLSQAVEQSEVTVLITDVNGQIEYINKKGLETTGYTIEEVIGNNPRIFSSGEKERFAYIELWNTIKAGNDWFGEFHNKKKSGELYWEKAIISPIVDEDNVIVNYIAIKEDITEKKRIEQELIKAKDQAEEMNRLKTYFIQNLSHELRTPLFGIIGFADLLFTSYEQDDIKMMSDSILKSGHRLLNTLNALLSFSEIESKHGNLIIDKIDVNLICSEVYQQFKDSNTNVDIEFYFDSSEKEIYVELSERLFKDAINHLLKNSIVYTQQGKIILRTSIKNIDNVEYAYIVVEDTGIGIPKEKQNLIFEDFRQASEGLSREYEGIGLGLTLTKKYVELFQGKIFLESVVNVGTKITITFPINRIYKK